MERIVLKSSEECESANGLSQNPIAFKLSGVSRAEYFGAFLRLRAQSIIADTISAGQSISFPSSGTTMLS
jgi:hypothetical protein